MYSFVQVRYRSTFSASIFSGKFLSLYVQHMSAELLLTDRSQVPLCIDKLLSYVLSSATNLQRPFHASLYCRIAKSEMTSLRRRIAKSFLILHYTLLREIGPRTQDTLMCSGACSVTCAWLWLTPLCFSSLFSTVSHQRHPSASRIRFPTRFWRATDL